jgi:hypothetical protein
MSDDTEGTDFETALRQYNADVIDDMAHGRPNRHGEIGGCFGRGYEIPDAAPTLFRWPEPWTLPYCMDCARPFVDREILHPECVQPVIGYADEMIVARCAACFARYLDAMSRRLASAFRGLIGSTEEAARCTAMMADALKSLGDPLAHFAKMMPETDDASPSDTPDSPPR